LLRASTLPMSCSVDSITAWSQISSISVSASLQSGGHLKWTDKEGDTAPRFEATSFKMLKLKMLESKSHSTSGSEERSRLP
jgi:hypothetical protein